MDKAIPAFYACYLLRSTVRHQSLYVGSTPNPVRRLRQHNGDAKGGAVRTSRDSLRPWEMTCLVTGFPSMIAALQFEWAWQNSHTTRHIAAEARLTQAKSTTRFSPKSGKLRKRSARPRLCLTDRLANLHLLLRSNSFERWPLKVTFYAEDVYHIWTRCIRQQLETLRSGITVTLDTPPKDEASKALSGIRALNVGYSALKPQIEKTKNLFETSDWLHCVVCHGGLPSGGAGALVCNTEGCNAASHIECLSTAFLLAEGEADAMIPTSGSCPGCNIELQWTDLVRELSMRMRGAKEVEDLFRERRKRKKGAEVTESDVEAESSMDEAEEGGRLPEEDGWHELPESSWDEVWAYSKYLSFIQTLKKTDVILLQAERANIRRKPNPPTKKSKSKRVAPPPPVTELIIEESDWEGAEVIA